MRLSTWCPYKGKTAVMPIGKHFVGRLALPSGMTMPPMSVRSCSFFRYAPQIICTHFEVHGRRPDKDGFRVSLCGSSQDKHPSTRVILVLDGADRFLGRDSPLVSLLSHLLSRLHGLHILITAEGSVLSSGSGRLESSPEKVVQLGRLADTAAAQLLVSLAPPGFK